jgi:hypothetical protein
MPHYLLTGAGFSANWGGWVASEAFEYLLGTPEIMADPQLRDLLWKYQAAGGFEVALAELQRGYSSGQAQQCTEKQLIQFQNAVGRMFDDMNKSFRGRGNLEFLHPEPFVQTTEERVRVMNRTVQRFLMRFKAIFTLNQDLLLEHLYLSKPDVRNVVRPELPGLQRTPDPRGQSGESWADSSWSPAINHPIVLHEGSQAYVKLHGSANWYAGDGSRVLIMGGSKQQAIAASSILSSYLNVFETALTMPDSRLMVIGYGFGDEHINGVIGRAARRGLKMFVIDPRGARIAYAMNELKKSNRIGAGDSELELLMKESLIGGSIRPLRAIFSDDETEHSKVMRFFSRP